MRERLEQLFGMDLRTLALFRVGLASLVLTDLLVRSSDIKIFYTDVGTLPRAALIEKFAQAWHISLHHLSGQWQVQAFLFVVAGLCALAMLFGYRTRLATFLSWFLLISLHSRNPMILNGGDIVLRMMHFWAIFLPLGASFSIDSALNNSEEEKPKRVLSLATIAVILQLCFIYWFAALLKTGAEWRTEYTAVHYALNLDQFATPLAVYIRQFPDVMKFFTVVTFYVEKFGPFLLFVPFLIAPFRLLAMFIFIGMHVSFGLCMEIGLFHYICTVYWLILLPSWFWDYLMRRFKTVSRLGLRIYYDGDCGFCKKGVLLLRTFFLLPETTILKTETDASVHRDMQDRNSWVVIDHAGQRYYEFEALTVVLRQSPLLWPLSFIMRLWPITELGTQFYKIIARRRRLGGRLLSFMTYRPLKLRSSRLMHVVVLLCFIYALLWNLRTVGSKHFTWFYKYNWFGYALHLDQWWNMFAPFPLKDDGWYVIVAKLKNKKMFNLYTGGRPLSTAVIGDVDWKKPEWVRDTYKNSRWRKYMMNLWSRDNSKHRLYYARSLCREWNTSHVGDEQLDTFKIYFNMETTPAPSGKFSVKPVMIWEHFCFKVPDKKD